MRCPGFHGLGFMDPGSVQIYLDQAVLEAGEPDAFKCAAVHVGV